MKKIFFLTFSILSFFLCQAQGDGYVLPPDTAMFGEGIRKVEIIDKYKDGHRTRHWRKIDRDGRPAGIYYDYERHSRKKNKLVKQYYDNETKEIVSVVKNKKRDSEVRVRRDTISETRIIERTHVKSVEKGRVNISVEEHHFDLEKCVDSCFRSRSVGSSLCLEEITFYKDKELQEILRHVSYASEGYVFRCEEKRTIGDTVFWDDEYFNKNGKIVTRSITKQYPGYEDYCRYSSDNVLLYSIHRVFNERGLPDTEYYWNRYGEPQQGCFRSSKRDSSEWRRVDTYQYEYNDRGALVESRWYIDGELNCTTHYKLKYYRRKRK